MLALKTAINALVEILQTPLSFDGIVITLEGVILFLCFVGLICLLIGGLFR